MIFLPGGPPHQDFFDLKPDAPAEIRGEFSPVKTNVPGIEICEQLPRMAAMMDKLVVDPLDRRRERRSRCLRVRDRAARIGSSPPAAGPRWAR